MNSVNCWIWWAGGYSWADLGREFGDGEGHERSGDESVWKERETDRGRDLKDESEKEKSLWEKYGEMSKISDEKIYGETKEIEASKSEANDENGENDGKEEMNR